MNVKSTKRSLLVSSMVGLIGLATTANAGPVDIADLRLWLDAGQNVTTDIDGNVELWGDVTDGVNNTVAQDVGNTDTGRRPLFVASAIGGQPALRFDGLIDQLDNLTDNLLASGSDRTIFVVGKASTGDANSDGLGGTLVSVRRGSSNASTEAMFAAQIYDNSGWDFMTDNCCGVVNPNAIYTDGVAVNHVVSGDDFPISTVVQPFVSVHRVSTLQLNFDLNGQSVGIKQLFTNTTPPPVTPEISTNTGFGIGGRATAPIFSGQQWQGDIAEVLIYERSLSASEVQQVNSFLGTKYGIVIPEPSTLVLLGMGVVGLVFRRKKR